MDGKKRLLLMHLISIIVAIFLIISLTKSNSDITGYASKYPSEVKEAIKNKQEFVELPISKELSRVFWIDYVGNAHATPLGTDCGPDSSSFKKIGKGIKWLLFPVPYLIDASASGIDTATAKHAVVSSLNTWDSEEHPGGNLFIESSSPNLFINWAQIDGSGSVLAITSTTYKIRTGEIVSSTISYDSAEAWSVYSSTSCTGQGSAFDIEDIGTHEIGHALGLGHVKRPSDAALTMYPYASQGETLKRTLGTGDKLGLDSLY